MGEQTSKLEALLDMHIKASNELKEAIKERDNEYKTRLSKLENIVLNLQINEAKSGVKGDTIWKIFMAIAIAIAGILIGYLKK